VGEIYTGSHHSVVGRWAPRVAHVDEAQRVPINSLLLITFLQLYDATPYDPLLSCWESQAKGVDQAAERGETGLDRLRVWERDQGKPGQEQTATDVGLQEQSQVVEVMLPASARVSGRMGFE